MTSAESGSAPIDFQSGGFLPRLRSVGHATSALLDNDPQLAQSVIDATRSRRADSRDRAVVWEELQGTRAAGEQLRHLVSLLLIIPELERSATWPSTSHNGQ